MKFEEIRKIQPDLVQRFERILESKRFNHAYLFSGSFGSLDLALLLAASLFCSEKTGVWPCGKCRSCSLIAEESFSDVTVVRPQNQLIKTELVRNLVQKFAQSGVEGTKQVFIICGAEKMHVNAANSLLKVIEEPASEVYVFFLTADEDLILPTIRSRTQIFQFPKPTSYLIEKLEQQGLMKSQADLLATYSRTEEEANSLATDSRFSSLISECERLVNYCLNRRAESYLQVAKISSLADDKERQEEAWGLLELLWAKKLDQPLAESYLESLLAARTMWRANVSFQNALEYMILKNK